MREMTNRRMKTGIHPFIVALLLVLAATQLVVAPSGADERRIQDSDDSASRLDIETVRQGHYAQYILYRIRTFNTWDPLDLEGGAITFYFNLDDDPAIERRGVVEYRGGGGSQLRAVVLSLSGFEACRANERPSQGGPFERVWPRCA